MELFTSLQLSFYWYNSMSRHTHHNAEYQKNIFFSVLSLIIHHIRSKLPIKGLPLDNHSNIDWLCNMQSMNHFLHEIQWLVMNFNEGSTSAKYIWSWLHFIIIHNINTRLYFSVIVILCIGNTGISLIEVHSVIIDLLLNTLFFIEILNKLSKHI